MANEKDSTMAPLGLGAALAEASLFMKSRVILSAAELDFFTALDERPSGSDELAAKKSVTLTQRPAARLPGGFRPA